MPAKQKSSITHDRLQQECWIWLHNSYPALRKTHWSVIQSQKPYPGENIQAFRIRVALLKAIGMTPGVVDFHFYHKGVLHVFDFKIDNDTLSQDQKDFIKAIELQGGKGYEIRSVEQFKEIIQGILF